MNTNLQRLSNYKTKLKYRNFWQYSSIETFFSSFISGKFRYRLFPLPQLFISHKNLYQAETCFCINTLYKCISPGSSQDSAPEYPSHFSLTKVLSLVLLFYQPSVDKSCLISIKPKAIDILA